jgi:putative DNA primase/helicase
MATPREEIERIARILWGEPNRAQSRKDELRFGANGSKSVDLRKLEWFDHELQEGGGLARLRKLAGEPSVPDTGPDSIAAIYPYRDERDAPLFQVVRKIPKKFVQRHADPSAPDGWAWHIRGVRRVLYRLPELLAADPKLPVFIPEGEKDVDNLRALGLVATCNPGGAAVENKDKTKPYRGKWRTEYSEHLRDRDVVILPDNDQAGRDHATDVVRKLAGIARSIRVVALPGLAEKGDASDWIAAGGTADALNSLVGATEPASATNGTKHPEVELSEIDIEAEIARLARLPLIKFEQQFKAAAELLGVRASMLERLVRIERGDGAVDTKGQGRPLDLATPESWPEPVNGSALLHGLVVYFSRHLVLPVGAAIAKALWTVHTHCFDAFSFTPRLQYKSVVKGSGKSTGIELLGYVVPKPLETETISPAFLYRAIELAQPTVLMDEADTYLRDNDDLRGVVNAGVKPGAQAGRCIGDSQEPRLFNCHTPIALAGIDALPGTIEDRAIKIVMKRRLRGEAIRPIEDLTRRLGARLCRKAARWARDHREELRGIRPNMKPLFNRAADRWRALYAIAEVVGGKWPTLARNAMQALASADDDDAHSLGERLLADVKRIFDEALPETELPTPDIVERLVAMQDRPWPEMGRSRKPLTTTRFTQMVSKFEVPRRRLSAEGRPWGYRLTDFAEPFGRYLDA